MPARTGSQEHEETNIVVEKPVDARSVKTSDRVPSPALIIVDLQNDFVRVGAPLEVPDARDTIAPNRALIEAFRARNYPVIYTRFISREEDDFFWLWTPECRPDTKCCWPGHQRSYEGYEGLHDCAEVISELAPAPDDTIIDKYGYGAFHGTDLNERLQAMGVESVLVTGTVTQICVEETAREAFHFGYRTTIVSDAVSSYAPDLHAATLKNFALKFGWVADSETVMKWL
jgi:nicotinamidase-related amidase